jgi:hypothetical protein
MGRIPISVALVVGLILVGGIRSFANDTEIKRAHIRV